MIDRMYKITHRNKRGIAPFILLRFMGVYTASKDII